jgi:two-component system KDP operon response regulator KdpE
MPELLARLRVASRHRRAMGPLTDDTVYRVGDVEVDIERRQIRVDGQPVPFTRKEFDFLALLARFQGKVLTHEAILRHVWGTDAVGRTEYLRTYANQIRHKLGEDPEDPRLVTEPGIGYRLVARDLATPA